MITDDVLVLLRDECRKAGSQTAWAREHDVSKQYVNNVLHGWDRPGDKILASLGLRCTIERIGE